MTKNLKDLLPIYAVENDAILSKMGDMTVGFSVELPELFTLSNEEYEAFHHAWIWRPWGASGAADEDP